MLLLVLEHPELPLHNNPAELAANKLLRRKISYATQTFQGTKAWDIFISPSALQNVAPKDYLYFLKSAIADDEQDFKSPEDYWFHNDSNKNNEEIFPKTTII